MKLSRHLLVQRHQNDVDFKWMPARTRFTFNLMHYRLSWLNNGEQNIVFRREKKIGSWLIYYNFPGFVLSIDWPITRLAVFITEDDCFNMLPGSARYVMFEKLFSVIREDKDAPHMTTRHNAAVWVR